MDNSKKLPFETGLALVISPSEESIFLPELDAACQDLKASLKENLKLPALLAPQLDVRSIHNLATRCFKMDTAGLFELPQACPQQASEFVWRTAT